MDQVYHSLLALARFFEETQDFWLSDHFYGSCLKTSLKIRGDGRRKESEANCNMGLASEKRGEFMSNTNLVPKVFRLFGQWGNVGKTLGTSKKFKFFDWLFHNGFHCFTAEILR